MARGQKPAHLGTNPAPGVNLQSLKITYKTSVIKIKVIDVPNSSTGVTGTVLQTEHFNNKIVHIWYGGTHLCISTYKFYTLTSQEII